VIGGGNTKLTLSGFNTIGAGSRVLCASDEFLGAGLVGISPPEFRDNVIYAPIILEPLSNIGTNVVIHPGVTIGEGSVIGSCSLVLEDTEPWTIYYGIPAKPQRIRPREKMLSAAKALGYERKD
jgi:galactoside O-acetyltransferase